MYKTSKLRNIFFIAAIALISMQFAGCARFASPKTRLPKAIYSPEDAVSETGHYIIGVRDELEILVWRCPELNTTAVVRPENGKVTVPLVGDVTAAGLTPRQLAEEISESLSYYVKEPRVAVGVKKFGEKKVFIMGQVMSQGSYDLDRSDRIIDVITRAGGFTIDAVPSSTWIIRGSYDSQEVIRVNLARLLYQGDISQNVYLKEGDIVYVPIQGMTNYNRALQQIFPTLFFAEKISSTQEDIMRGRWDWSDVWAKMGGRPYPSRKAKSGGTD
jgi:polysaccharide biosynthesis/export protein